jgi:hypothetical protein
MTHLIHCDLAAFWTNFLDGEFHRKIFMSELGYPEYRVSQQREGAGSWRRRVEITPKVNMPAAFHKIIGDMFSYVEAGELYAGVYRFELLPATGHPGN